ncbi:MAG: CBS domain-containing protein [Nanoarchaeota archaeon]
MGVYFSELQNKTVYDKKKRRVGVLLDMVFNDGEQEAKISHLVLKRKCLEKLPMKFVDLVGKHIELNVEEKELTYDALQEDDFTITHYILDKQIVDVDDLKVVRVNDTYLDRKGNDLVLHSVDIGTRGFFRRLGIHVKFLRKLFRGNSVNGHSLIAWEHVQPLHSHISKLKLKVPRIRMAGLHPADIADIMEDLSARERVVVMRSLDDGKAGETLTEAHPDVQHSLLRYMRLEKIVDILEHIRPEQAASILENIPDHRKIQLLRAMKRGKAAKVKEILAFDPDSAGGIMQTDVYSVSINYTMTKVLHLLRKKAPSPEKVYYLYVTDEQKRLVGILSLRTLLITPPRKTAGEVMRKRAIHVNVNTPKEDVARLMIKYNLIIVPVVDAQLRLKGVVTAYEVLTEVTPKSWKLKQFFPSLKMGKIK